MFPRPQEIRYPDKKAIQAQREYNQKVCAAQYTAPSWEKLPELARPMSFSTYIQKIGTTQPANASNLRSNIGCHRDLQMLSKSGLVRHSSELIGATSVSTYQRAHRLALDNNPSVFFKSIGYASNEVDRLVNAGYKKIR